MNELAHYNVPEIGHGLIALAVLAAAALVLLSSFILLLLTVRMLRAWLGRLRQRRPWRRGMRVDARLQNLASQRAG